MFRFVDDDSLQLGELCLGPLVLMTESVHD